MSDADIPLSLVFGFERDPDAADGGGESPPALFLVRQALERAPAAIAALSMPGVAPALLLELAKALRTTLGEIATTAWSKRGEIRKYGDPKAYPPNVTHEVSLYEHKLEHSIRPSVTVSYAGREIIKIVFVGTATLTFDGAMLVIRGGRLRAVRLGDVTAEVALSAEGAELVTKQLKQWKLRSELVLGNGVTIPH